MEQWRPIPPADSENGQQRSVDKRVEMSGSLAPGSRGLTRHISHVRGTLRWLGWGRIVTGIVSVPLVGWGAFFLLRSPTPPVDTTLAYATTVPAAQNNSLTDVSVNTEGSVPVLVTIHVAGQVFSPGVYRFSPGVRVVDAVRAAGGATQDADLNAVNLAGTLDDGQQIYIPALGERSPGSAASTGVTASTATGPTLPIHLNQATAEELDILPGVGPSTALAIVTHRERNGPFLSLEGLLDVPGIGPAKLAALAGLITV